MNDADNLCGAYLYSNSGFIVIDGTVTTVSVPGSSETKVYGINNLNQCAGFYIGQQTGAPTPPPAYGFLRDADGTFIYPFATPGANSTIIYGINDNRQMVGVALEEATARAVFIRSPNDITLYQFPGSTYQTRFTGITNSGLIAGQYYDSEGSHGFIVRVRPAARE